MEARIPKDYNDLVRQDGAFVKRVLSRINRGGSATYDDVFQHIILKLIEADVLGKFQRMVAAKMPLTMSAEEACRYLGIKFPQWRSRQHSFRFGCKKAGWEQPWKAKWAPEPVDEQGMPLGGDKGYAGKKTRYLTTEIERLGEEKGFRRIHFQPEDATGPVVSASQWQGYLKTAIHNHWANYCRTASRRHKERTADRFSEFRRKAGKDGEGDWTLEGNLSCEDGIEAKVDLHRLAQAAGPAQTEKGEGFLDLVEGGYTGMEALEKLGVKTTGRLRVALRHG